MRIRIQKFGGTSLATPEARMRAVRHVKKALEEGVKPVVVVSAMGRKGEPYATDTLIGLVGQSRAKMPAREMDLLMHCGEIISAVTMCGLLLEEGLSARVLTGGQAGIVTTSEFGHAQIVAIQTDKLAPHLEQNDVVIVTGFQGVDRHGEPTTLGRGGSDTTATALGAALQAECVDIFTDVDGILTADPKIVENARRIRTISYAEICQMAYNGAKVVHPRAVELALQAKIPLRVRSTFRDDPGTLVVGEDRLAKPSADVADHVVTGIAHVPGISQIRIRNDGMKRFDMQLLVFREMARRKISVDFINVQPSGIAFTVFEEDLDPAMSALRHLQLEAAILRNCGKVAVIGGGMNGVPGIMASIMEALAEQDIPILQSADSNTTIWILVNGADLERAVQALHDKFQLHLRHA